LSEIEVGSQGYPVHGDVTTRTVYLDFYVLNYTSTSGKYLCNICVSLLDEICTNVPIRFACLSART